MRPPEKLDLIDKLGRALQSKFSYADIDSFLQEYGISPPKGGISTNSKWTYSKAALQGVSVDKLVAMAQDLDVQLPRSGSVSAKPPKIWQGTSLFRLFISHISKDKLKATRLKECLAPYGITGFVAHEDIQPTLEWQNEIERALHSMDALIAIHTPGFSQSYWTQQEIGFALGRGTKVISFKMGEDPTGFISKQQALARRNRTAEQIAEEIDALLAHDEHTAGRLAEAKKSFRPATDDEVPF